MGVVVGGRVADDDGRVPDDVYIALGVSAIHTTVRVSWSAGVGWGSREYGSVRRWVGGVGGVGGWVLWVAE